jgi:creatinine amidohydrolase/Fe(II)-dependent formamide hydrolase-like protein
MAFHRAEELTYADVRRFDRACTIAFQPVSALEVHGPHLPLGMDWYMARWMAEETGRRFAERHPEWTVVALPALSIGADELPLRGSMSIPPRTLYRAIVSHGRALAKAGYGFVVVTNGHGGPRHAAALEAACRWVSRRHRIAMFTPSAAVLHRIITGGRFEMTEQLLGRALTERERHRLVIGEHAGGWETSFMLAGCVPGGRRMADARSARAATLEAARPARRMARRAARAPRRRDEAPRGRRGLAGSIGWLLNARFGYGGRGSHARAIRRSRRSGSVRRFARSWRATASRWWSR